MSVHIGSLLKLCNTEYTIFLFLREQYVVSAKDKNHGPCLVSIERATKAADIRQLPACKDLLCAERQKAQRAGQPQTK